MSSVSVRAISSLSRDQQVGHPAQQRAALAAPRCARHGPVSNAARAAATARSTSSGPAWSTVSTTLASNGLIDLGGAARNPSVHAPSM